MRKNFVEPLWEPDLKKFRERFDRGEFGPWTNEVKRRRTDDERAAISAGLRTAAERTEDERSAHRRARQAIAQKKYYESCKAKRAAVTPGLQTPVCERPKSTSTG